MTATDPTPQPGEFHEPDERPDDVAAAFDRGERGVTAPPPPTVQASGVTVEEPTGERTHMSGPLADADMTEAGFDAAHAAGEPVTVVGIRPPWWRVTTDPAPQPATHASGPLAGQPVTPTPVEQLVEHIAHHRPPGRPVVDCQWCPEPEPEQVPVVVLEDALCRGVWAAALRWAADQLTDPCTGDLSSWADAIQDGLLTPWADQPEPPAAPAQPAGDATAAAGPTPAPTGPAILGRARELIRERLAADPDLAHQHRFVDVLADVAAQAVSPLLVDPSVARVVEAARWWRRQAAHPVRPTAPSAVALTAAVDALGEPAPDDQRRCPATHPAHGQCELHQGHRPHGDPDRRHRTGALEWLTDAEIRACALPPLASYAGTADLQSGPANASESAGGTGWDRETVVGLADGLAAEVRGSGLISPERVVKLRRQVLALLADRDRLSIDAEQAQDRIALAESAVGEAEREVARLEEELVGVRSVCDRLRVEVARVTVDRDRLERLVGEEGQPGWDGCSRAEAIRQAEAKHEFGMRMSDALETVKAELAVVTESEIRARAEVDRLEEELVGVRGECDPMSCQHHAGQQPGEESR